MIKKRRSYKRPLKSDVCLYVLKEQQQTNKKLHVINKIVMYLLIS